jgi:hypothetical protein
MKKRTIMSDVDPNTKIMKLLVLHAYAVCVLDNKKDYSIYLETILGSFLVYDSRSRKQGMIKKLK